MIPTVVVAKVQLPEIAKEFLSAGFLDLFHTLIQNEWLVDTNQMFKDMVIRGIRGRFCDVLDDLIPVGDPVWMQLLNSHLKSF